MTMADEPLTFEDAMARLERIVADLESGSFSLEDSLKKYEEGIELGKTCRAFLDRADVRVRTLTAAGNGDDVSEAQADDE
jgi:exodeoxyribonuclease VII small subunit